MDRARRRGVGDAGGVEPACTDHQVGYNCTIECKVGIRNIITPFTVRTTICHSRRHASIPFGHSTTRRTHTVATVGHRPSITHAGAAARANSSARGRREHPPLDAAACRVPSRASAVSSALSPRCRCYESRRESKVTRRGYANSGRTRQWHHHRACGGRVNVRRLLPLPLLLLMRYGIHPPEPAQHMRRRHRTCVHRRARWRAAPAGNAKTHSTPPSHDDDGVEHK